MRTTDFSIAGAATSGAVATGPSRIAANNAVFPLTVPLLCAWEGSVLSITRWQVAKGGDRTPDGMFRRHARPHPGIGQQASACALLLHGGEHGVPDSPLPGRSLFRRASGEGGHRRGR